MLYTKHNFEVAEFCAASGIRPEITGILVAPDKTAATDTYVIVEVSAPTWANSEEEFPVVAGYKVKARADRFICPKEAARRVLNVIPRKVVQHILKRAAVLDTEEGTVGFLTTDLKRTEPVIAREIDGKYPEYEDNFPTRKTKSEVTVNANYLAKLGKFFAGFKRSGAVTIKTFGVGRPILFEAKNDVQTARAVLASMFSSD